MYKGLGHGFRSPELDGLRGIAILMVLEAHYDFGPSLLTPIWSSLVDYLEPILSLGGTGVDLFFVLSGFLLGGILLDNREATNYFKVFYTRRICRIFPLYFLVVILLLIVPIPHELIHLDSSYQEPLPSWTYITFTQNIAMAQEGSYGDVWLSPTWSLAVEEQFYLILPFLIWFVSSKRLPYLLISLILLASLSRLLILNFHSHGDFAFFLLLPSTADSLFLGVLGAWIIRNQSCLKLLQSHIKTLYGAIVVLATSIGLLVLGPYRDQMDVPPTYGYSLLSILYLCIILVSVTEQRGLISFVTRNELLGKIGIISYGVYLFHLPVRGLLFWLMPGVDYFNFRITIGALLLTMALASVSWIFFERRIISLGRSFRYNTTAP